ncbi:MAG TPA: aldo/keto reductase [Tepidisphaeraceae bacterium]|jgi:L-galactose dehydrogenase|nr:aldo/keto reductase [Tepidisphaeraceae bacterium]
MEYRELGKTGLKVSTLSFGASSLGAVFHEIDESDAVRTVHAAVEHGINFIDVSPYYGATKAETVLGRALKDIPRERYYLATKVGQYGEGEFDFSAGRVTRGVDESLRRLNVDYVDLIQCHDIEFVKLDQIVNETLPALHRLKQTGKVRHVGITGLPLKIFPAVIDRVAPGMVETILSFCRYELNDTSLEALVPYFKKKGIGIINASPTGMGLLTERGTPGWHPASETIKAGCRRAVAFCKERGINIVELAIQFSISHPDIATTLVGTASSQNILDNIHYAEKPLDREKLVAVMDVLKPIHNFNFTRGLEENRDPILL